VIRRIRKLLATTALLGVTASAAPAQAEGALRTVLVIDASSSMRSTDPKELRKVAAELFVDLTREGDQLAVVGFDGAARDAMPALVPVRTEADRAAIKSAVRAVGNDGAWTDFTAGLEAARRVLDASKREPGDQDLIVFLTDGRCDPDPHGPLVRAAREARLKNEEFCQKRVLGEILPALGRTRLYAVGLSKSAPRAFLEELGQRTGGTGMATDRADELPRLFADIYARLFGSRLVEGPASPSVPIAIDEGAASLDVVVVGPKGLVPSLLSPDGDALPKDNHDPAVAFTDGPAYRLYRALHPKAGTYKLDIEGKGAGRYAILQNLDLALGFLDLPDVLEVGKPRAARFRLATPGGKTPARAFLDRHAFALQLAETASGCDDAALAVATPVPLRRGDDGIFEATITPQKKGGLCLEARMTPGDAGVLTRTARSGAIRVIPPIHLTASIPRGFGPVKQQGIGQAEISFDGSEIGEFLKMDYAIEGDGLPTGAGLVMPKLELSPGVPNRFLVDLRIGRDTPPGPREIVLRLVPRAPSGFEDRAVTVRIPVAVVPLSFWERHGRNVMLGLTGLFTLFLVLGISLPARFRKTAVLHYEDLRDPELPRRASFPLGARVRPGFWRPARVMIAHAGPVRRGGVLELCAGPGGMVLGRTLGGKRARELSREDVEMGPSSGPREVRLVKGRFRVQPGVRYDLEGTGLVFWWSVR
jgi:hypothetical protein